VGTMAVATNYAQYLGAKTVTGGDGGQPTGANGDDGLDGTIVFLNVVLAPRGTLIVIR